MKLFLLVGLLLSSVSLHANVYCKVNGEIINVLDDNGLYCNDELFTSGSVCFSGSRSKAIAILQSAEFIRNFSGTDGESIQNVHFKGRDAISYDYVDLANGYAVKFTLNQCSREFFR